MNRPVIGIFTNKKPDDRLPGMDTEVLNLPYSDAVLANGGIPLLLPYSDDFNALCTLLDMCGGLIIPGGCDIDPGYYGEHARPELGALDPALDEAEMVALYHLEGSGKPVFGICRGMQLMNVYAGGTLYQDLGTQYVSPLPHRKTPPIWVETHSVCISDNSVLKDSLDFSRIEVNSLHHQAVKDIGRGYKVTAVADDGVIEAIEREDAPFFAVQWHPEMMVQSDSLMDALFKKLITLAKI